MSIWCAYLLECADGTYYIGSTNDVAKRIVKHNAGKGARYTRGRTPVKVMKVIECGSKSEALRLEARWKKEPRDMKTKFEKETK